MTEILKLAEYPEVGEVHAVLDDLAYLRTVLVNVFFVGVAGAADRQWVLVDAGLPGSADRIIRAAKIRFGAESRPAAIVLTHGHFDHVGALELLADRWNAPIYAHLLELPYLTGRSSYPAPDPSVGGGLIAALSWSFFRGPIDLGSRVKPLPEDMTVPGLPGWRWLFTPGHSAGHISLFRDTDRTLIAGDAIITTKLESAQAVLSQRRELRGPPRYYTTDWKAAADSVAILAELDPEVVATGHGEPLRGASVRADLRALSRDFDQRAVPRHGRYVTQPAVTDRNGIVSIPPELSGLVPGLLLETNETVDFVRDLLDEDATLE